MQPRKKFISAIKKICCSLTLITGLSLSVASERALANVNWSVREITRIGWESGEPMNCNGEGVEVLIVGSNMHSTFYRLAVACLTPNREEQADWVILGGISFVYNNRRENVFLQRSNPETNNSGDRPNLYSFAKFAIGYNCRILDRKWQCQEYSDSINNNVLKVYGLQQLKMTTDYFSFRFGNLDESKYYITN